MATLQTKAIAFFSLCFGFGLSGCYDGNSGAGGGTDSMGTDTDGADDGDGDDETGGPTEDPPENVELVPETMSRRMTRAELNNTLSDLMGDATEPANTYLSEEDFSPYDNDYNNQLVSRTLIESMEVLSVDVAERLIADPARRSLVVPCTPSGPGDEACFRQAIETFGRLALRRPLTAEEVDAYATLQEYSTENIPEVDNDFYTGIALVISAIIQDPDFLYRIEAGTMTSEAGVFKLNDFEIASRISYLLWGSTPDDQLIADAEAGMLAEPEGRAEAIDRVLQNERAQRQLFRYHAMWLGYRGIPHEQTLVDAFNQETSALIQRVVFDDASSYTDLFTSTETYVDTFLADHYGLPQPAGGEGWVDYGEDRAGILSHGSVLAAFSKFTDTSPTQRGILIGERLRCIATPTPPPTVDADNPPGDPDDPNACKEDRYLAIRAEESCDNCHKNMDPIGMGLENYDIAGRYRETDEGKPNCVISGQGELPGVGTFSGPGELADRLVESGELERCVTKQYMEYALGRPLGVDDAEVVNTAFDGFETNGYDFRRMIADYATGDAFGFRRESGN
ncbi:MAG: DUF1592 domain-containing protein [Myxococcota bacterium]